MNFRTRKRIAYFFKARHRKGHGIHSPFLFRLITRVVENDGFYSAYPILDAANLQVRKMVKLPHGVSFQRNHCDHKRYHSQYIKTIHLLPPRFDRLLFRLVNEFTPRRIGYYGSTFGTTLLALGLADRRIPVIACVAQDTFRSCCQRLTELYGVENLSLNGTSAWMDGDFVVVQHPMDAGKSDQICEMTLSDPEFDGILVVCGMYTTKESEAIWLKHKANARVRIALDLFEIGIMICKKGLQKEEFVVRY